MRIAICFSGQIRTGCHAADNIRRFIGDLLPACDFFVHTWDFNMQKSAPGCVDPAWEPVGSDADRFQEIWQPVQMVVESYDTAVQRMQQEHRIPICSPSDRRYRSNSVSPCWMPMYYSWYRSVLMKRDHELMEGFRYEFVVKLRPDVIYPRLRRLQSDLESWLAAPELFYTDCDATDGRIDDVLWFASSDVMDRASCYWLAKLKHPEPGYGHYEYMQDRNMGVGSSGSGYAPLRPWCVAQGLDPMTQWGRIYAEDIRFYAANLQMWDGRLVSFDEWLARNQEWLDDA